MVVATSVKDHLVDGNHCHPEHQQLMDHISITYTLLYNGCTTACKCMVDATAVKDHL